MQKQTKWESVTKIKWDHKTNTKTNKKAEFRGTITKESIQEYFGILETCIESGLKKFSDTAPGSGAKGGDIAFALKPHFATTSSFPVQHSCPEAAHLTLTYNKQLTDFCIYRPLPRKKNKFSASMLFDQFSFFLEDSRKERTKGGARNFKLLISVLSVSLMGGSVVLHKTNTQK